MKKFLFVCFAVIAFIACQKEVAVNDNDIEDNDNLNTFTFTATISDTITDVDTKATIGRNGVFSWVGGEELKFYDALGYDYDAEVSSVAAGVATITVTAAGTPTFVTAIYPAAAADGKNKVNFNARGPIVVAEVGSGALTFHHIGSLINVKISGIPAGTSSLVFKPASAWSYNGTFSFTDGVPSLTSTGTTSEIVVPASTTDGTDGGKDITISVPAVSITGGFSIALNNASDGSGRNLYKKVTTKDFNLASSAPALLNMKKLDYVAPSEFYVTTKTTPASSYDVTKRRLLQTGATTYEIRMNFGANTNAKVYDNYNLDNPDGYVRSWTIGEDPRIYHITYDSSTDEASSYYVNVNSDGPFYDGSFPNLAILGEFNSWSDVDLTYDGNHYWHVNDVTIASTNTYQVKIRKKGVWDNNYNWGLNWIDDNRSPKDTRLYGTSILNGGDGFSVTLAEGKYNIYLNALTCRQTGPTEGVDDDYYQHKGMNIMFEKQ